MLDPISLVAGAALVGVGWTLGRLRGRKSAGTVTGTPCGCGHDLALHDRATGQCHGETFRKDGRGMREWARCGCRQYTGPTPLDELLPPPLLPPT